MPCLQMKFIKITMTYYTMDLQAKAQVMAMVKHNDEHRGVMCEDPGPL